MTVATTDDTCVWAFRYSSENNSRTLFYSTEVATLRGLYPEIEVLSKVSDESRLIVSEPLRDLPGAWNAVPESSYGVVQGGQDELHPFTPQAPSRSGDSPRASARNRRGQVRGFHVRRRCRPREGPRGIRDGRLPLGFVFSDIDERYAVTVRNGALSHRNERQHENADATVTLARSTLDQVVLGHTTLEAAVASGDAVIEGDATALKRLLTSMDAFQFWFDIVTP